MISHNSSRFGDGKINYFEATEVLGCFGSATADDFQVSNCWALRDRSRLRCHGDVRLAACRLDQFWC